jgi:phospholipid/cholesterol/gamma-HCH transport system permease protein
MSDHTAESGTWLDVSEDASSLLLRPLGDWVVTHSADIDADLQAVDAYGRRSATFDLSHLGRLDTAGAWLIHRTRRTLERAGSVGHDCGCHGSASDAAECRCPR